MSLPSPESDPRIEALTARLDQLERRSQRQRRWLASSLVVLAVLGSTTLFAQTSWAPAGFTVFNADSPALASEVNANFQWLVQNPGAVFLTTGNCPTGYTSYTGGQYIRLGTPSLTPVARTLVSPAHRHEELTGLVVNGGAHFHSYNDYYWRDINTSGDYGTPDGDGSGDRVQDSRNTSTDGAHTHAVSGRVGPLSGALGDSNVAITGELQHITLRLCVRT
jgi:hypothetical protein